MFKLVIQDDEGKTTVVPLIRDEITIGRKEGNTIRLTERNVSRRHARILRNNGEVQIEDLGSYNGIRVNNARIAERVSLRISDQVQIGDYKLYLKAEGVEQVDDARTMPIERVENTAPPAEAMPAIAQAPMVPITVPQGIPTTPMPPPVRSPVATADTDPAGRPVASAAQVAALTTPVGYGKLVVVSSNFAGKEFDLTRPQMIIGRTDENDFVINHRSISRNHAKITRDADQRYTISDLQSSNGVRVNGQDYGKVELRRSDVVDLGHVRLRFVEPGEDWIFARDAQITDVPEAGGKKGLLVAILLALLVAGGIGAFFVIGGDKGKGSAKKGEVGSGAIARGSDQVASGDNGNPTHPAVGSNAEPVEKHDATTAAPPGDEAGRIKVECLQARNEKKWDDLGSCADRLAKLDPDAAKELKKTQKEEMGNYLADGRLTEAINGGNLKEANKELGKISDDSVYKKPAQQKVADLEDKVVKEYKDNAAALRRDKKCPELATLTKQARDISPAVGQAVAAYKCEVVAANPPGGDGGQKRPPGGTGGGSNATSVGPPPAGCDADELKEKGTQSEGMGQHAAALSQFEQALRCKPGDGRAVQLAFMAACNGSNVAKARQYYARLAPDQQKKFAVICIRQGIKQEQLEGK